MSGLDTSLPTAPPPPSTPPPAPRRRRPAFVVTAVVVVLALLGGGIALGSALSHHDHGAPGASSGGSRVPVVTSLTANPASPIEVDLAWASSGSVSSYRVYRDGTLLTTSAGGVSTFDDVTARPGRTYTYGIVASDAAGHASGQRSVTATTPGPPALSQARLDGEFLVKATFTAENYTNFKRGQTEKLTWRFSPRCDNGPCAVRVDIFAPHERFKPMRRSGRAYTISGTARLGRCGSSSLITTVTIRVKVTKARYVGDEWTAIRITGTLKEYTPATLTCQSGSSTERLAGSFRGL